MSPHGACHFCRRQPVRLLGGLRCGAFTVRVGLAEAVAVPDHGLAGTMAMRMVMTMIMVVAMVMIMLMIVVMLAVVGVIVRVVFRATGTIAGFAHGERNQITLRP